MLLNQLNKIVLLGVFISVFTVSLMSSDDFVFDLKTSDNKSLKITIDKKGDWKFEGIKNKVVLLDFFATWCPPCKAGIPHLNNIKDELKNEFEVVAVDIGQRRGGVTDAKELSKFIKKYNITYPVTTGKENNKLFAGVGNLNQGGSIPFMVAFSKSGKYLKHYIGMQKEEILKEEMKYAITLE